MSNSAMVSRVENDRVLVLERVFDAPRELVFSMFKEPEHLKHWWGPKGWDLPVCNLDFRPGGVWHYCMKCVDESFGEYYGMESWGKGIYKEIDEPDTIVYTDYFSDAEGNMNDEMPSTDVTMQFIDLDGRTKLVSRSEYVSAEALKSVIDMGMMEGVTETWDRLEERLNAVK
ncbi:SRPBCC domain-containing protein [Paenibacillus arenilitoris]|uniref:SRPBCC domain-containing protein n=1 Tax=Paenibacillus arenilitoris TaxID=2772299 RepID=A0A927CHG6_9BACL|nr:SRPBCC domain-containing protein [Paenibacillus arenilitoris]MBD2868168.1 SRPBCC domain-containing protein [Paenibacillus arenilitoris]